MMDEDQPSRCYAGEFLERDSRQRRTDSQAPARVHAELRSIDHRAVERSSTRRPPGVIGIGVDGSVATRARLLGQAGPTARTGIQPRPS